MHRPPTLKEGGRPQGYPAAPSPPVRSLEEKFHGELQNAGIVRAGDLPESRAIQRRFHRAETRARGLSGGGKTAHEIGVVEDIKRFGAYLQFEPLADLEDPAQPEIEPEIPRSA